MLKEEQVSEGDVIKKQRFSIEVNTKTPSGALASAAVSHVQCHIQWPYCQLEVSIQHEKYNMNTKVTQKPGQEVQEPT